MTQIATPPATRPYERIEPLLKHVRPIRSGKPGVTAQCPAHDDAHNSLTVWEDEDDHHVGVQCYANCSRAAICAAWGISEADLHVREERDNGRPPVIKLSLFDFCAEKLIHPNDLIIMGLGVTDRLPYHKEGKNYLAVRIPYFLADGTEHSRARIRYQRTDGNKGLAWTAGDGAIIPYGLQRLSDARAAKYVIVVEGETDCWTLWAHGFPALGIPGASMGNKLQAEHLFGIDKVFIIQEPDNGGRGFAAGVLSRLSAIGYSGQRYVIDFRKVTGEKDPNDLHKKDIAGFKDAMHAALASVGPRRPTIARLADLRREQLPAIRWAIDPILPEGVTILGGKPKLDKSWLALTLQVAIAEGGAALGKYPVERGEVLYISLEDNKKLLQKRTNTLLQSLRMEAVSSDLFYATDWPRLNDGGQELLAEFIDHHPRLKLICIDPWARIKPKTTGRSQPYDDDYEALTPLQQIAGERGMSILIIDHLRKMGSEDPLDLLSGSVGKAGAVDGFLLLDRKRGETDARLYVTGRDIENDQELLLSFDPELALWTVKGEADENTVAATPERQAILNVLRDALTGLKVKEIAESLGGKNVNTTRNLLVALRREGKVALHNNIYTLVNQHPSENAIHSKPSNHSKLSSPDHGMAEGIEPDDEGISEVTMANANHSNHRKFSGADEAKIAPDNEGIGEVPMVNANHRNLLGEHPRPVDDVSPPQVTRVTTVPMDTNRSLTDEHIRAEAQRLSKLTRVQTPDGPGRILSSTPITMQVQRLKIGVVLDSEPERGAHYYHPSQIEAALPGTHPVEQGKFAEGP